MPRMMAKEVPDDLCRQLPYEAREALARAAQTPVTASAPMARQKAIDAVVERVKARFPRLFTD